MVNSIDYRERQVGVGRPIGWGWKMLSQMLCARSRSRAPQSAAVWLASLMDSYCRETFPRLLLGVKTARCCDTECLGEMSSTSDEPEDPWAVGMGCSTLHVASELQFQGTAALERINDDFPTAPSRISSAVHRAANIASCCDDKKSILYPIIQESNYTPISSAEPRLLSTSGSVKAIHCQDDPGAEMASAAGLTWSIDFSRLLEG